MSAQIDSLQIGMHWFNERLGGLDRMFKAPLGARLWGSRRQSRALLTAKMPDVVATHFALYAAPTAGLFRSVPKVVHFHGPWVAESYPGGGGGWSRAMCVTLERFVYRGGTRHIVLSQAFGKILRETYGVRDERIRVVPGCVDVAQFDTRVTQRQARERLGLPLDWSLLFCMRRLVSRMGLEDLIDAIAIVKPVLPDVLLKIPGKGPLQAQLQARIVARGLELDVRLAGYVPDDKAPLWYRADDMTVVPTVSLEGFGLTIIESLAAGTPVLVTPVGGLPEAVAPLSAELVLPSCGFKAIGDGITEVLLGRRVVPDSQACRAYARQHFDRPVVAAQVAHIYREAIDAS